MTHTEVVEVTLPSGLEVCGQWRRTAWLRPLNGRDEAFLAEEGRHLAPAQRTTSLLARTLESLGGSQPVTRQQVNSLIAGDREALVLQLRRLTLGDRIACVVTCPADSCGEKMDLDIGVDDLLVAPYGRDTSLHEARIDGEDREYLVRFRLPTGEDLEAVASIAADNLETAVDGLLRNCIVTVKVNGNDNLPAAGIPEAVRVSMPRLMSELDPQAEIKLNLVCPGCGAAFLLLFDSADYFFRELTARREELYREVHHLAFHYHWSESEILSMTRQKRRLYLTLLADALNREGARGE